MINTSQKKASLMKKLAAKPPKDPNQDLLGLESGELPGGDILQEVPEEETTLAEDDLFSNLNDLDLEETPEEITPPVPVGGGLQKPRRKRLPSLPV